MASYAELAKLRRSGQRPIGPIYVTDDWDRRNWLNQIGLFWVPLPKQSDCVWLAGMWVHMIAEKSERTIEVANWIYAAEPHRLGVQFGEELQEAA